MNEFFKNLTSMYWWVSVVIVGVVINIVSAYIKNNLDSNLFNASSWWRKRSVARKAARQTEIERLRGNLHAQYMLSLSELRHRIRSILFILLAFACFTLAELFVNLPNYGSKYLVKTIAQVLCFFMGTTSTLMGMSDHLIASRKSDLLEETGGGNNQKNE